MRLGLVMGRDPGLRNYRPEPEAPKIVGGVADVIEPYLDSPMPVQRDVRLPPMAASVVETRYDRLTRCPALHL